MRAATSTRRRGCRNWVCPAGTRRGSRGGAGRNRHRRDRARAVDRRGHQRARRRSTGDPHQAGAVHDLPGGARRGARHRRARAVLGHAAVGRRAGARRHLSLRAPAGGRRRRCRARRADRGRRGSQDGPGERPRGALRAAGAVDARAMAGGGARGLSLVGPDHGPTTASRSSGATRSITTTSTS